MDIIVLVLLFISIVIHEYAHAYTAYLLGDPTAQAQGRLTLNPLAHIDLIGTIILPLFLWLTHSGIIIGWAKPVPINPMFFRNRIRGIIMVSFAGPLANILLAGLLWFIVKFTLIGFIASFKEIFLLGISLNLLLALFNLIPLAPLDGSKILLIFIPQRFLPFYFRWESLGFPLLIIALYLGLVDKVLIPIWELILKQLLTTF